MYENLKTRSVLYVEDESDVLANIGLVLRDYFDRFFMASNAEEAFRIFQTEPVDVLLVDIELPGMNGLELIKKVRKTHKNLPVVVISAYTKTDYLLESVELHLDKYIVKPLTSRKIHEMLERLESDFAQERVFLCEHKIRVDTLQRTVSFEGRRHALTRKETEFLKILCRKKMVTYEELMLLWEDEAPSENAMRSFIKHLRKKLPEAFLKNRNGIGYYVENSDR